MAKPFRLTVEGYRDPGEPEHQRFGSLTAARERADAMRLARYAIWEKRPEGDNGRWFCIWRSHAGWGR